MTVDKFGELAVRGRMADWEGDSYHGGSTGRRSATEQLDLLRSLQLVALGACALLATSALVTLGVLTWQRHVAATLWRAYTPGEAGGYTGAKSPTGGPMADESVPFLCAMLLIAATLGALPLANVLFFRSRRLRGALVGGLRVLPAALAGALAGIVVAPRSSWAAPAGAVVAMVLTSGDGRLGARVLRAGVRLGTAHTRPQLSAAWEQLQQLVVAEVGKNVDSEAVKEAQARVPRRRGRRRGEVETEAREAVASGGGFCSALADWLAWVAEAADEMRAEGSAALEEAKRDQPSLAELRRKEDRRVFKDTPAAARARTAMEVAQAATLETQAATAKTVEAKAVEARAEAVEARAKAAEAKAEAEAEAAMKAAMKAPKAKAAKAKAEVKAAEAELVEAKAALAQEQVRETALAEATAQAYDRAQEKKRKKAREKAKGLARGKAHAQAQAQEQAQAQALALALAQAEQEAREQEALGSAEAEEVRAVVAAQERALARVATERAEAQRREAEAQAEERRRGAEERAAEQRRAAEAQAEEQAEEQALRRRRRRVPRASLAAAAPAPPAARQPPAELQPERECVICLEEARCTKG